MAASGGIDQFGVAGAIEVSVAAAGFEGSYRLVIRADYQDQRRILD